MKRILTIVVAVSIALSMTACDALDTILQTNLFGAVGGVSKSEIAAAQPAELVELGKSESFYDTLEDNPETKTEVLTTIDTALDDPKTTPEEKQDLAILAADIQLKTTGGDEVVNKITDVLMDQTAIQDPNTGETDPARLLVAIMPEGVVSSDGTAITNPDAFVEIINGLVAADAYYDRLGAAIGSDGYADDTVNAGAIAQSALVAAVVASIEPPPASGFTSEQKGEYLLALISRPGDETLAPVEDFEFPNTSSGSLGAIFAAAGIDLASLMPSGEE